MKSTSKSWRAPLLALLVLSAGCDSFLDENPVGTMTSVTFYQNEADALAALNGAYQSLHSGSYLIGSSYLELIESTTPHLVSRGSSISAAGCWDSFDCSPDNARAQSIWTTIYDAINTANAVVTNVPGIENMNEAVRSRVVAEAKFLRAFHYFNLVRLWGGVPLRETETRSLKGLELPRSSADEVYDFIIADLTQAQADLPPSYPSGDYGRATRGAAQMLLAKVYLQRGIAGKSNPFGDPLYWPTAKASDLPDAISELRKVTGGPYSLVSNYGDLFDEATERNSEVIFSLQNILYGGQGSDSHRLYGPLESGWGPAQWQWGNAELPFYQSYADSDARREVTWLTEFVDTKGKVRKFDPNNILKDSYPFEGPAPNKYLIHRRDIGQHYANPKDLPILRYGDALLMLAEAINEQNEGPTGEALALVNQIRARAKAPALASGMGYAEFREALYNERGWELATEQHSLYDAARFWDLFTAQVRLHSELGQNRTLYPLRTTPQVVVAFEEPKDRLLPIPQEALDRNRELVQNPGW